MTKNAIMICVAICSRSSNCLTGLYLKILFPEMAWSVIFTFYRKHLYERATNAFIK